MEKETEKARSLPSAFNAVAIAQQNTACLTHDCSTIHRVSGRASLIAQQQRRVGKTSVVMCTRHARFLQTKIGDSPSGIGLWMTRLYIGFPRAAKEEVAHKTRTRPTSCPYSHSIIGVYVSNIVDAAVQLGVSSPRNAARGVHRALDELRTRRSRVNGVQCRVISAQHKVFKENAKVVFSSSTAGADCKTPMPDVASVVEAIIALVSSIALPNVEGMVLSAQMVVSLPELIWSAMSVVACVEQSAQTTQTNACLDVAIERDMLRRCHKAVLALEVEAPGLLQRMHADNALRLQVETLTEAAWPSRTSETLALESGDSAIALTAARRALSSVVLPGSLMAEARFCTHPPHPVVCGLDALRNLKFHRGEGTSSASSSSMSSFTLGSSASLASGWSGAQDDMNSAWDMRESVAEGDEMEYGEDAVDEENTVAACEHFSSVGL